MRTPAGIFRSVRASLRVLVVFALAGVFFVASRVIPHFPHPDRDHQGPQPPSASDIAWTSWALTIGLVAFGAAYLYWWWKTR
jgi:hypothetical protein